MNQTSSYIILCGLCCIYPGIIVGITVFAYRRYLMGGWRAIIFGENKQS